MIDNEEKKYAKIRSLRDIIGGLHSTEKQRQRAWEKFLPLADNSDLGFFIAAKYSWLEFPENYKEKAWQELNKRGVENDRERLHYLSVNAPEPWCKEARRALEGDLEE
jgi:hypothetical protein